MSICITGAAGFIGGAIASALLDKSQHVIGVDNLSASLTNPNVLSRWTQLQARQNFVAIQLDIRNPNLLDSLQKAQSEAGSIQTLIHLAAKPGVRDSHLHRHEYNSNNIDGTREVLNVADKLGIREVIFASSSCVYGGAKMPFVEVHPNKLDDAVSHYGWTKIQGELLTASWAESKPHVKAVVLRLFSVYGKNMRPDLAISIFQNHLLRGTSAPIYGEGRDTRDYTYIADVVRAVMLTLSNIQTLESNFSYFNIGCGKATSTKELLAMVGRELNCDVRCHHWPRKEEEMTGTLASTMKAANQLNFRAKRSLTDGLRAMFEV